METVKLYKYTKANKLYQAAIIYYWLLYIGLVFLSTVGI